MVTHALDTSCLDYCNSPYAALSLKTTQKFRLIQDAAVSTDTYITFGCYIGFQWFSEPYLSCWLLSSKLSVVWDWGIYRNCLILKVSVRPLRRAGEGLLRLLPLAEAWLMASRERAFVVTAPLLWNFLPTEVCLSPSPRLTMELYRKAFKFVLWTNGFILYF